MPNNILQGHEDVIVSGSTITFDDLNIYGSPKKFEFSYGIENFKDDGVHPCQIEFIFDAKEGSPWASRCRITFIVDDNKPLDHVQFDTPIECVKVGLWLTGNFNAKNMVLYGITNNVNTASTQTTGVVRPIAKGGLKVVEEDVKDKDGNVLEKAGDLSLNIGDGLNITPNGELTTASDLSGSNLQSVIFYTALGDQGMCVNGVYHFKKEDGGMRYLNGDRLIPVVADTGGVASAYKAYLEKQEVDDKKQGVDENASK